MEKYVKAALDDSFSKESLQLIKQIRNASVLADNVLGNFEMTNFTNTVFGWNQKQLELFKSSQRDLELAWSNTPRHNFSDAIKFGQSATKKNEELNNSIGLVWTMNSMATVHNATVHYSQPRKGVSKQVELKAAYEFFIKTETWLKKLKCLSKKLRHRLE